MGRTIVKALLDWLLGAVGRAFSEWRDDWAREELGAARQREGDLSHELERTARAAEAGSDPALLDPERMRDDRYNRDHR